MLSPYYNIPGEKPDALSGNLSLLAPANNVLLEFLADKKEEPGNDTILAQILARTS